MQHWHTSRVVVVWAAIVTILRYVPLNHSDPDFLHGIDHTKLALVCVPGAQMHMGKSTLILTTENLNLALVVDVGSCFQQPLNCLSVSLLGSYPQRNTTILMREGNREWLSSAVAGQ